MYVEFIGVSGSGKTTARKASMEAARGRGLKARDLYRYCSAIRQMPPQHWRKLPEEEGHMHHRMLHLWKFCATYPNIAAELLEATNAMPNYQSEFTFAMANHMILDKLGHQNCMVTVDEGVLHRSIAAVSISGRTDEWADVMWEVPLPDAIVYLRVTPKEAAKRAEGRGRVQAAPEGQIWNAFARRQIKLFDQLADHAEHEDVPVVLAGEKDSPEDIAARVADLAEQVMGQANPTEERTSQVAR